MQMEYSAYCAGEHNYEDGPGCWNLSHRKRAALSKSYLNMALQGACEGGHSQLAQDIIERGADDLSMPLYKACWYGHRDVVELLIRYVADVSVYDYGLKGACRNGEVELVQLMIEQGTTDWTRGLTGACKGGHVELARDMIERGATVRKRHLRYACDEKGDLETIQLILNHGITIYYSGFIVGYNNRNIEVMRMMMERGVERGTLEWILRAAEQDNELEIAEMIRVAL
jgi:ankyrin repeat protein